MSKIENRIELLKEKTNEFLTLFDNYNTERFLNLEYSQVILKDYDISICDNVNLFIDCKIYSYTNLLAYVTKKIKIEIFLGNSIKESIETIDKLILENRYDMLLS